MKKLLTNLSLAAATVLLLGSCAKINERIDSLESRIDGLEREDIATIGSQIESINSSIADLGTIRKNIQDLTATTAAQAQDIKDLNNEDTEIGKKISDLKKADESINTRIDNLQKYVNDTLKAYATTEWVNATFSTLAQYEATCDTIAKIDARLGSMDARLSKSIEDCADSLKTWVNVQLDGYYTIAEMDAKVAEMKAQIDTLSGTTAATADSLAAEITDTKTAIDTARAQLTREYKAAIETAITALDGKLSNELQTAIDQVNLQINNLTTRINNLQTDVTTLTGRVTALEDMIQSVVIVPAYSDGSVRVDNDSLYIDCLVSPDTVVKKLDTADVVILVNKVKTKAFAGVDTVKIKSGDVFEKDITNGSLSIRVKISDKLPASADSTITVALNVKVKNGISNYTTDFAPIYVKPLPAGALKGKFTVNAQGKKVHFSQGNLYGDGSTFKFEDTQYAFQSSWSASHVSHFFWSKDASVACAGSYSDAGASGSDVFFTNETETTSKDGFTVNVGGTEQTGWRTLSTAEWTYLFNNHTKKWATVNGVNGYVIAPDGFTGELAATYADDAALAAAGNLVFLPAAGYRSGSSVFNVGFSGYYRSSTAYDESLAYLVNFSSSNVGPDDYGYRGYGYSVRLITDAK